MLDDFREWLSDNLRYILLGLAVLLVAIIAFCVVRIATGGSKQSEETAAPVAETAAVETVTEAQDADGADADSNTAVQSGAQTDLVKDDSAVLTLVKQYYTAAAGRDVETLSKIVSPWNDEVKSSILDNSVIESYNNIATYSKDGMKDGESVVFAYYEGKMNGFETLAPSLSVLYLITDETGKLVVASDKDSDPEISAYITKVSAESDVQKMIEDVKSKYEAALASDPDMATYLSNLDTTAEPTTEAGTEAASATGTSNVMQAAWDLNIRQEPNTDANILGSIPTGYTVIVLSEADANGWVQIQYDGAGTPVIGYVMLQYLTEAQTASTSTGTTVVDTTADGTTSETVTGAV